jgi:hypothetical protein
LIKKVKMRDKKLAIVLILSELGMTFSNSKKNSNSRKKRGHHRKCGTNNGQQ